MKIVATSALTAVVAFFLGSFGATPIRADILYEGDGTGHIEKYSSSGTDLGTFYTIPFANSSANALAFDTAGDLYLGYFSSSSAAKLLKITPGGTVTTLESTFSPGGVAVDSAGNVYASNGNTIEKYSSTGADLGVFATVGTQSNSSFDGLAFDSAGNLYGANFLASAIDKITPSGGVSVFTSGNPLSHPIDLAFDITGRLYVSSGASIIRYSSSGAFIDFFNSTNANSAEALAFDSTGNLYVADNGPTNIEKYSSTGTDLGSFKSGIQPEALAFTDNLGRPLILPGGVAVPEPATWAIAALATAMLITQIVRAAAFTKPMRTRASPRPKPTLPA